MLLSDGTHEAFWVVIPSGFMHCGLWYTEKHRRANPCNAEGRDGRGLAGKLDVQQAKVTDRQKFTYNRLVI